MTPDLYAAIVVDVLLLVWASIIAITGRR